MKAREISFVALGVLMLVAAFAIHVIGNASKQTSESIALIAASIDTTAKSIDNMAETIDNDLRPLEVEIIDPDNPLGPQRHRLGTLYVGLSTTAAVTASTFSGSHSGSVPQGVNHIAIPTYQQYQSEVYVAFAVRVSSDFTCDIRPLGSAFNTYPDAWNQLRTTVSIGGEDYRVLVSKTKWYRVFTEGEDFEFKVCGL